MKLHLPKKLKSALLLAVLAASATAPSFAAVSPWTISCDEGQNYATVGSNKTLDFSINQAWNSDWSIIVSADASSLQGTLNLLGVKYGNATSTTGLAEGVTMANGSLKLSVWNDENSHAETVDFSSCQNITFVVSRNGSEAHNLSLKVYDSADFHNPLYTLTGDKAQNASRGRLRGAVFGGKSTYTPNSNVSFEEGDSVGSYRITKAGYSSTSNASFTDMVNYYYGTTRNSLTWEGDSSGNGNWSNSSWSTGSEGGQSFTNYDNVTFATEGANVALSGTTSVTSAAVNANTTFNLNGHNLTANTLTVGSGKTLTVEGGGKLDVVNNISGVSIDAGNPAAENASSVEIGGERITNSTIKGKLILTGNTRKTLSGTVTLDSVVNDAGYDGYSLIGSDVTLTFTGASDLTKKSDGSSNENSRIGLNQNSSITIASGASLKTSSIFNSYTFTQDKNASLTVEKGGTLDLVGHSGNTNTCVKWLNNAGTITSLVGMGSYENITNTGSLEAHDLSIYNLNSTASSLGGTVKVTQGLWLGGTTTVAGVVTAGYVELASGANAATTKLTGDSKGTLNINLASDRATANVALEGSFGINKTGNSTQNFSGNTSGYSGALNVSGGTLNLAQMGESSNVTQITISGGATLGLYKAATMTASTANETTVTFGEGGKLTVGELGGTLNANVVMNGGSTLALNDTLNLGSSLTLNGTTLTGGLLNQALGRPGSVTLFSGVDELYIGDSSVNRAGSDGFTFTQEDLATAFALSDEVASFFANDPETGKPAITMNYVAGANGGSITMTSNVPEPATATLSLLALAALAARRRRK